MKILSSGTLFASVLTLSACSGPDHVNVAGIIAAAKAACGLFFTDDAALKIGEQYIGVPANDIAEGLCAAISPKTIATAERVNQNVIFRLPNGDVVEGTLRTSSLPQD